MRAGLPTLPQEPAGNRKPKDKKGPGLDCSLPPGKGTTMHNRAEVPGAYRQLFFVNAGGPSRKVVSREVVKKKWQLVTLDCAHRILLPRYQKAATIRCGFCGGLEPMAAGRTDR